MPAKFRLSFPPVQPGVRRRSRALLAALALGLSAPTAAALGAVQLTVTTDQPLAYRNGVATPYPAPPRLVNGKTMLPLRETAALLNQTLSEVGGQWQLGRLTVDPARGSAFLAGAAQPQGNVASVGSTLYVSVRLLADALNATLSVEEGGRTLTLTALREGGNPLAPQARFSTDKATYAPGERVVFTDYPFDPDGADIVSRKWTGRQDVYFQPGNYTVTLQVTNSRGLQSAPFTRTLRVEGAPVDSPLSYALKYAEPGDRFPDPAVLTYPVAPVQAVPGPSYPLLFSDSPEAPTQSGVLYQDSLAGRARLLAYHLNALSKPARLYVLARNLEARPVEVRTERSGETAPTRIEGLLGQVTLLDYFASAGGAVLNLAPGQSAAVYASPTLNPGSGVNLMQDLMASGRVELTFLMLEEGLPPTAQVAQQLPYLPMDGKHQRGTFPNAVRSLRVNLGSLPARLVIGDGQLDPAMTGVDRLTGLPQRLVGNYGVLYDLEVTGAAGTAVAFSPRGGLYRGAMQVQDGPIEQTIKLPRTGNALTPDQPVLLWRAQSDRLNIDFVPASGSNLPVSLVFYRARPQTGFGGLYKTYQP
ncbi:copper amine oxidase N-terminal domain-containing protein [Deinococcus budaensis]|uniref:PKD repeat protein n=1 Tax=Deinococcus budaensis TaxID=1665626 RepID=A0A7W8GHK1_9DEIO|nr:copper amine oxidase N-terminal domain-containing protein [Deinococcus budaensis]MBB5235603.1 PKD repeat protein [Deinococcus budaensis]